MHSNSTENFYNIDSNIFATLSPRVPNQKCTHIPKVLTDLRCVANQMLQQEQNQGKNENKNEILEKNREREMKS